MSNSNLGISTCRHCQYYKAEGRRGGQCQQLNALVQGSWKACSFAIPPFAPTWENLEEILSWTGEAFSAPEAIASLSTHAAQEVTAS